MPGHLPRRGGIIPAYAGSTSVCLGASSRSGDHPRIRGEHDDSDQYSIDGLGSSPHTRGARLWRPPTSPIARIIPAYAGSTPREMCRDPTSWDHPRIRGEHLSRPSRRVRMVPSSPHTRGAPPAAATQQHLPGIIPAYAGSTGSGTSPTGSPWDHPRIRGEHFLEIFQIIGGKGSSPHTRGAQPAA